MIKHILERVYRFLVTIDSDSESDQKVDEETPQQQVSIEEYNKAKKELEQVNAKVETLEDSLKEEHRYDIIAAMHEGIDFFKNEEDYKKASVESFAKSNMTIDEIKTHLAQVRRLNNRSSTVTTKLPQKSIQDDKRVSFID
jgi:cupin superfamily acireductone dioxygenase involved in methionine salvage